MYIYQYHNAHIHTYVQASFYLLRSRGAQLDLFLIGSLTRELLSSVQPSQFAVFEEKSLRSAGLPQLN